MNCEKCSTDEVRFRVYSDIINLIVCTSCAKKARRLGLAVEAPPPDCEPIISLATC